MQYYFYSREELFNNYELINVSDFKSVPTGVNIAIINGQYEKKESGLVGSKKIISFNYNRVYTLDHYKPHYPHNIELDAFKEFSNYIEKFVKLDKKLRVVNKFDSNKDYATPGIQFSEYFQKFTLNDLAVGGIYKLNYAHLPFWKSEGARIFRGSGEKIYLEATSKTAVLKFSRWISWLTWLGLLTSVVSLVGMKKYFSNYDKL